MGNELAKEYDFPQVHNATAGHCQLWKIFPAVNKETKEEVSLWIMKKDDLAKRKPIPITDKATLEQLFQILRKDVNGTKEIEHGSILRILKVFEENRNAFAFASERVVCSLADLLSRFEGIPGGFSWHNSHVDEKGALTEVEISRGLLNIAEGLLFLHNVQRKLHMNVAPENIMITPGGQWKLCGFGFCISFQADEYQTASPYFFTSPCKYIRLEPDLNYSAPELSRGAGEGYSVRYITSAADFFSLGITAYELFRYNLRLAKEGKVSGPLLQNNNNSAAHHQLAVASLPQIDLTVLPTGVTQLVVGMLQMAPSARISGNDVVNNAYFHSGPLSILHALDTLHTRDLGSQASQLSSLPAQLSAFPARMLEATILPAVGRVCHQNPQLWVYALPLHVYIAERISLPAYTRVAGPQMVEGLAVTHPPETMLAFIKHLSLLQDKFDIEFFRQHVVRMLCNSIEKIHPGVQVAALTAISDSRVSNAIDRSALEKDVVPRICKEACKNLDSSVKVKSLYVLSLLSKRLPQPYLQKNYLPSLKYIAEHFKSPAISMCVLGVYEAISDLVGHEAMANQILPIITPMLSDRTMSKQQFELVAQRVEVTLTKIFENRSRELGIVPGRTLGSGPSKASTTLVQNNNSVLSPMPNTIPVSAANPASFSSASNQQEQTTATTSTANPWLQGNSSMGGGTLDMGSFSNVLPIDSPTSTFGSSNTSTSAPKSTPAPSTSTPEVKTDNASSAFNSWLSARTSEPLPSVLSAHQPACPSPLPPPPLSPAPVLPSPNSDNGKKSSKHSSSTGQSSPMPFPNIGASVPTTADKPQAVKPTASLPVGEGSLLGMATNSSVAPTLSTSSQQSHLQTATAYGAASGSVYTSAATTGYPSATTQYTQHAAAGAYYTPPQQQAYAVQQQQFTTADYSATQQYAGQNIGGTYLAQAVYPVQSSQVYGQQQYPVSAYGQTQQYTSTNTIQQQQYSGQYQNQYAVQQQQYGNTAYVVPPPQQQQQGGDWGDFTASKTPGTNNRQNSGDPFDFLK